MIHGALSWKSSQQLPTSAGLGGFCSYSYPFWGVPNDPTPYSAQIPESQQKKRFHHVSPLISTINPTEISWHIWVMFTNLANINQISVPDMHEIWLSMSMDEIWWNHVFDRSDRPHHRTPWSSTLAPRAAPPTSRESGTAPASSSQTVPRWSWGAWL